MSLPFLRVDVPAHFPDASCRRPVAENDLSSRFSFFVARKQGLVFMGGHEL
jgi:hypothetical protein